MNHDENNPDLQAWIEPEVEARLVAWVLGEASAFEAAELERLVAEKPELAIFKRRIEAVHGLVGAAQRPDQAPMRLAPERRAKILQTIGVVPEAQPVGAPEMTVIEPLAGIPKKRQWMWTWRFGLAACVTFGAIAAVTLLSTRKSYYRPQRVEMSEPSAPLLVELPTLEQDQERMTAAAERKRAEDVARNAPPALVDQSIITAVDRRSLEAAARMDDHKLLTPPRGGADTSFSANYTDQSAAAGRITEGNPGQVVFGGRGARGGGGGSGGGRSAPAVVPGNRDFSRFRGVPADDNAVAAKGVVGGAADNYAFISKDAAPTVDGRLGQEKKAADEIVALSPFEVSSSKDRGYYASNTMSGTRLNSKLSDLASSITVTTKQELADTSTLNVNDVFLYEANAQNGRKAERAPDHLVATAPTAPTAVDADSRLSKEREAEKAKAVIRPAPASTRVETSAAQEPVSTFSLHVSDVSFRLAQAALARGEKPDPQTIRAEEFYNAFDYGDPTPTTAEKISCFIEQAAHPSLQQRNLVRIAMKVPATGRGAGQPLHLTILLDTSGSMEREDRVAAVRRALEVLASLLGPNDRVTLIGFAQQPRLLAEQLPGNQGTKLVALAASTPFTGGTNMEEALKLAGELARRHRDPAAQNRIVLLTDGAANLGNADPAQLAAMIEALRQQGVAFDACGVGTDGLDDAVLEALTRKGDGRYYVFDQPEDADAGFARQLAGAFRPAAENVKVQVRFNPARVGRYRLLGFEQHRLREEDFRNDKVDAAELAAEEAAVAIYQVEVLPQGEGELGDVFVRFRDAATGNMVERSWTMMHEARAAVFARATPTMQLAGVAAMLAEKLGGGETAGLIDLADLAPVVNGLRGQFANDKRVQELVTMFEQTRRMSGK